MKLKKDYSLIGPSRDKAINSGLVNANWYKTQIKRDLLKKVMKRSDFKPIIDSNKIGLDVSAFITVYSESSKNFEKVVLNATNNPNVMKCYTTTGDGSHLLLVKVGNTEKLEKLLRTIQSWPGVSRTQTQIVLSSYNNADSSTSIKN